MSQITPEGGLPMGSFSLRAMPSGLPSHSGSKNHPKVVLLKWWAVLGSNQRPIG